MAHGRNLLAIEPHNGPIVDREPKGRLSGRVAFDVRSGIRTTTELNEWRAPGAVFGTIEKQVLQVDPSVIALQRPLEVPEALIPVGPLADGHALNIFRVSVTFPVRIVEEQTSDLRSQDKQRLRQDLLKHHQR